MKDMLLRFRLAATPVPGPVAAVLPVTEPGADLTGGPVAAQGTGGDVLLLQGFAEGRTLFRMPDADSDAEVAAPAAPEDEAPQDPAVTALSAALLRRFGVEHLPGEAPVGKRHALILQRLSVVRDTCEVMIAGKDRSVRIVMANGRVMAATFDLAGRRQQVVSFRKKQAGKSAAREFAVLLAELCAGSVDLLMTECPASGVFDVAAGMVVGELVAAAGLSPADVEPEGEVPARSGLAG